MKKKTLWIVLAIVVVVAGWMITTGNKMTRAGEEVKKQWGNVETDYQHRKDLVSMAINIVKGAGNYEQSTLEKVIQARNQTVNLTSEDLTEENMARFRESYDKMSQEMNRAIQVTVERYPELTATENYREFQAQVEGCENRINVSRKKFNESVEKYNRLVKVFPNSIVASLFGHQAMDYFRADEGAQTAPSTEMLL